MIASPPGKMSLGPPSSRKTVSIREHRLGSSSITLSIRYEIDSRLRKNSEQLCHKKIKQNISNSLFNGRSPARKIHGVLKPVCALRSTRRNFASKLRAATRSLLCHPADSILKNSLFKISCTYKV